MRYNDLIHTLQNLTKKTISQTKLSEILNCKVQTINKRALRNSNFSITDIETIEDYFDIDLSEKQEVAETYDLNAIIKKICEQVIEKKITAEFLDKIIGEKLNDTKLPANSIINHNLVDKQE